MLQRMKRCGSLLPVLVAALLTATAAYAATQTVAVPAGDTLVATAEHGFHGQTVEHGQTEVSLAAISEIEGVPVCTDHNATVWHGAVKRDAADAIVCTYGHEHHSDPNSVNDIFGEPAAWYGGTQEISYPWQTSSTLGLENHVKHEGYKWYVLRDMECRPVGGAPNNGCLRSVRVQVHTLGTASDATTRFHSYSMEALVEHNGVQGIVRHGGWIDFGHLSLNTSTQSACPPITSNPTNPDGTPAFTCGSAPARTHSSANVPPPKVDHNSFFASWYGQHRTTQLSTTFEEWGPVDYTNPSNQLLFPATANRTANNSSGHLGNIFVDMRAQGLPAGSPITFNGHTNSGGVIVTGCTAIGPECVPLKVEAAPRTQYTWNAGVQGPESLEQQEFDVVSPSTGKSLIRFPN